MLVLVIMDTVVVVLLGGLVAGLLRSHADILRALHSLGAGVGDPAADSDRAQVASRDETWAPNAPGAPTQSASPLQFGPPLPPGRDSTSAHDIEGVSPEGDALALPVADGDRLTLLAFLSSGCSSCLGFWEALSSPERGGLPQAVRPVVVTKGPELEIPAEVRGLAPSGITIVMSSKAWDDYEVPGSPFFVLVDGVSQGRVGEGVARNFKQVAELVRRALRDATGRPSASRSARTSRGGLDGGQRETLNDRDLKAAGIHPGHPSLYPRSIDEVFGGPPLSRAQPRSEKGSRR